MRNGVGVVVVMVAGKAARVEGGRGGTGAKAKHEGRNGG